MVSIPKIVGVMSCAFVLSLGLSNASQAAEKMSPDPCAERKGGQPNLTKCSEEAQMGIETIKGELLRVDGETYSVKKYDGKEAALHVDGTTQVYGNVREGDPIEAKTQKLDGDRQRTISIKPLKP